MRWKTGCIAALMVVCGSGANAAPAAPPVPVTAQPSWQDFNAVTTVAYRFAEYLDMRKWREMRTIFYDTVDTDTTAIGRKTRGPVSADEHVWHVKIQETGFEGTLLMLSNPQVTIEGDRAKLVATFYGEHVAAVASGDNFYTVGGYQTFGMRRVGGRWLIDSFILSPTWQKGNREIMSIGIKRGIERLTAAGDPPPPEYLTGRD
ncbi:MULTISPECIES: nuclear transport factor 2 family protein [unclassified Sphingobium]|uniref:nuclear transport factor 2 family protein n=1 Tax=unclassified Sphingobium TaxID=2611147 RepID=UPI000D1748B2|nr:MULTISPECIES: nuclear transport factor 2 family protein [unclassified Sphingobium]MBG6119973.1 hypothetical protein [Sphingobium sp. JAI105]PSO11860.1 hypothetical protein C7E20_10460 [Sphingobium sp. AEW4]TWC99588.1 SnoaL-like protein [Sphingobium sp. AEW010]TWD18975.1 SnoaL-like protein [Sphingobium sp. AEW013]TWD21846.1 SnoaL-like protein [Sphingobium sp. AEW001]